jgi:hypothetical protein
MQSHLISNKILSAYLQEQETNKTKGHGQHPLGQEQYKQQHKEGGMIQESKKEENKNKRSIHNPSPIHMSHPSEQMSPIIDVSSHSIPFRARFAPVPYIQKGENVGVLAKVARKDHNQMSGVVVVKKTPSMNTHHHTAQLFQYPPNKRKTCLWPIASSHASCSTPPLAKASSPSGSWALAVNSRQMLWGSSCRSRSGA